MKTLRRFTLFVLVAMLLSACAQLTDAMSGLLDSMDALNHPAAPEQNPPPDLPHNLNPLFIDDLQQFAQAPLYTLDISLDQDGDIFRVTGSQQVRYTNQETVALDAIYFKLIPNMGGDYLAISGVTIDGQLLEPGLEFDNTVLRLDLPAPLAPAAAVDIAMQLDLVVPTRMGGNYGLFIFQENILALDAFFPIIPVYNDEGWNVEAPPQNADVIFSDAAFFSVMVDTPADFVIATGGQLVDEQVADGRKLSTFTAGPQREFYLAASPDFVSESVDVDGVTITSYFPEQYSKAGRNVLETARIALQSYNQRFGPYPYTELDLVSTPMQAGGMEYSSITALGSYLYDPEYVLSGGLPGSAFLEAATAHEIAHMWFYAQVMNDQIDHPWQDESLVQYATYLYYLDRYGENNAAGFKTSFVDRWDRVGRESISIALPAPAYQGAEYGAIIYGRGALMFADMRDAMGAEVFDQFLASYVDQYRWQVVEPDDLLDMAEQTCACDLSAIYREYGVEN